MATTGKPAKAAANGSAEVAAPATPPRSAPNITKAMQAGINRGLPYVKVPVNLLPRLSRKPLSSFEKLLKREEADIVLVAGNVVLVAFEIIEWPVAALTLLVHALARTRFKALEALAEVAEEVE